MERNQFWLFFGFALLLALAAAGYQHASEISMNSPRLHQTKLDEDEPMYSGTDHLHLRTGFDGVSSFARAAGLIARVPAKKAEGENKAKPEVKTAAKKVDPKKKDDKKKKETPVAHGLPTTPGGAANTGSNQNGQDSSQANGSGAEGGGSAPSGGGVAAANGAASNGVPVTLSDWEAYILTTPNLAHTTFMIQMYQTGVLKAAIYFQILPMMIADTRDQMRGLGVMVAGAAPSAASFSILVSEDYLTSEISATRSQAASYLRTYAQLGSLKYLLSALSQSANTNGTYMALNLLQIAAKPYLASSVAATQTAAALAASQAAVQTAAMRAQAEIYVNQRGTQGREQTYDGNEPAAGQVNAYEESSSDPRLLAAATATTRTAAQAKLIRYFSPFVTVVTQLAKSGASATIRSSAQTTLTDLETIVGTPATTAVATTTASN